MENENNDNEALASKRRKVMKAFKANAKVYDDFTIEVKPQGEGQPSRTDVKKLGRCQRYTTTGKNPLTCIELKCPAEVVDKAAFFQKELDKLTKDIQIEAPQQRGGQFLIDGATLKVHLADNGDITAWLGFSASSLYDLRQQLYHLSSTIDTCFVINQTILNLQ